MWIALGLSVLIHGLSLMRRFDYSPIPLFQPTDTAMKEPFEIVEIPQSWQQKKSKTPRTIVQTEDAGNQEEDPAAKFLSDRTQTAKDEERAKTIGEFKTGLGEAGQAVFARPKDNGFPPEASEGELPALLTEGQVEALSLKDLSVALIGDGAKNDSVSKDVRDGERTVLSTREFRFFGYYQRIRDLLRQHWSPNVQAKLMKLWQLGKVVNANEFTTEVHVLLDRVGRVQKIAKVASCGNSELDMAAVEAFERAGPFPNPPHGMLDDDGFVRINWSFILTTEAAPRVQFNGPGTPH